MKSGGAFYHPSLSADYLSRPVVGASMDTGEGREYSIGGPGLESLSTGTGLYPPTILNNSETKCASDMTLGGSVRGMSTGLGASAPSASAYYTSASLDCVAKDSEGTKSSAILGEVHTKLGVVNHTRDKKSFSFTPVYRTAEVGIGAGAKICQAFEKSSKSVEDWEKKPAGVIRLYFVFQEEFEKYAAQGFNDLIGNEIGYLEGLPVGGSHE
jgi:hypothetical protein